MPAACGRISSRLWLYTWNKNILILLFFEPVDYLKVNNILYIFWILKISYEFRKLSRNINTEFFVTPFLILFKMSPNSETV